MNKMLLVLSMTIAFLTFQHQSNAAEATTKPLYNVTVVQTPAQAINYRNLKGSVKIDFKGTVLLPSAKGEAKVWNKRGETNIKAWFENLTPPHQFGTEYLTYVLWAISPDGRATNLGELIIDDGESSLRAKSSLQTLSLLVTAEPYFAVSQPSDVVVLENAIKPDEDEKISLTEAKYELLPRGQYTKKNSATDRPPQRMDKETPFYVYQARNAVQIAKASGAEKYEADGFKNAERLLTLSETKDGGRKHRIKTARQAVQSAEDSRSLSLKRQSAEGLATERTQSAQEIMSANTQAAKATESQALAEKALAKAEQAIGKSDTERAAAMALATSATASSTKAQAEAVSARAAAEEAKGQAVDANNRAERAEGDQAVLRAQLLEQLNSVLQTRDSVRGLIVNMSDALFETGSSTLGQAVREKLAKVAGIVSSHSGLKLNVEGHTDSVGSQAYNQQLSEKRAESARAYLVKQGVASNSIKSQGFGESNPIESNKTTEGRQKNRRVEIVVSGEAIGILAQAR
jgi:outer membrane protein OmpA-like peptidoglycan-associated protein